MLNAYPTDEYSGRMAGDESRHLTRYAHLVKRACAHLRSQVSASFSTEDFEQVGLMGLLEALRRYGEPDDEFESFAFVRIRGAILDELRRQDWRPRSVRQASHNLSDLQRTLLNELGREPSEQELATRAGLTSAEVRELQYASHAETMQSLEDWMAKGGDAAVDGMSRAEIQIALSQALAAMNERDRLLIALYYQHELNMKEIALTLGLSESRVCQMHKECLATLNQLLRD